MGDTDVRRLCGELATLHRALGAALAPDPPDAPDRSNRARPALLWCTTHGASHRRDQWREQCAAGRDPRRAGILAAATRTATAPRYGARRPVPTSSAPLDLEVLAAQEGIGVLPVDLAAQAREALGDLTRERTHTEALERLPMLHGRLDPASGLARRIPAVLAALERRARYALELDRRPLHLAECPSDQQPYAVSYSGGELTTAEWVDGLCREYDEEASLRATRARREAAAGRDVEPVEIWRPSTLYIREPEAPIGSDGRSVRCDGCGRVWRTAQELRELHALLHAEDEDAARTVAATRAVLYARMAAAMRAVAERHGRQIAEAG